jgi:hypothetical protein
MKQIILIFTFLFSCFSFSQNYIQIVKTDINIRMKPTTSSHIIGHAFYGEIYELNGEQDKWFSVLLPSGETRWIYKRLAQKIEFEKNIPEDLDIEFLQEKLKRASHQANKDANEEFVKGLNKLEVNNMLFDRYVLLTLQEFSVSPVHYNSIIDYQHPSRTPSIQPVAEHLMTVSHVDYDFFKLDFANIYFETRRCFKLGTNIDAMLFIYYESNQLVQKLCFEDGYGKGFNNCYNIKNIYESVLSEPNLIVLTQDGKIKKTELVLKETIFKLPQ